MRTGLFALALVAASALTAPAWAQSRADEARWEQAQRRFEAERDIYERERERYEASRGGAAAMAAATAIAAAMTSATAGAATIHAIGSRPAIIATTRVTRSAG